METVLYEYQHNIITILANNVVIGIVGIGLLSFAIGHTFLRKMLELGKIEFYEIVFIVLGYVLGPILTFGMVSICVDEYNESLMYEEMLANNEVQIVEGYVEKYHPMPFGGHDSEHFEINGVYFDYSNFESDLGYNDAASHGGVVTENGQHLKIKYIAEDRIKIKSIEEAIKDSIQDYKDRAIFIVGSFYVYKKVTEII